MGFTREDRQSGVRELYDKEWEKFEDIATVELDFLGRSEQEQRRLNRFKLWELEHGGIVSLAGKDILEFGAGHGRLAVEIPYYASYVGVDLSPNLVKIGMKRLERAGLARRARLIACDCLDYNGPEEAFDVVCSLGMFEYVEKQALRKMVKHLKPGGMLFFDVHHSSPLYDPIRRLRWKMGVRVGGTRHLFSSRELRITLNSIGLTDVRIVMSEYPFLGGIYARQGWKWVLALRNWLSARSCLNFFAVNCYVFGTKPK